MLLAVAEGRPDIAVPAVDRRSCMALEVVVVACLAGPCFVALGAVRLVALPVSQQRTLHRRHWHLRARARSDKPVVVSTMLNGCRMCK